MSFGIPVRNGLGIGLLASTSLATGNVGLPSPALSLTFAGATTLDPRITFSRPSQAMLYDSTGLLTYAPNNLVLQSQTLGTTWGASNVTVSNNATVAPDGTTTAELITPSAANATHRIQQAVTASSSFIYSLYVKASGYTKVGIWDYATTGAYASFDCTGSGSVLDSGSGASSAAISSVGDGWYRISFKASVSGTVGFAVQVLPASYTTGSIANPWLANGTDGVYMWGAQLEAVTYQTTPSTYVATVASAYYGPRFDYNPATLAARGLLIEEARTNLLTYSEQFDNAAWTKNGTTIATNATTAPAGTLTADKWQETAGGSAHVVRQSVTVTNGVSYVFSVYAKADQNLYIGLFGLKGTVGKFFNLSTGTVGNNIVSAPASSGIQAVGNGWYRCWIQDTETSSTSRPFEIYSSKNGVDWDYSGTLNDGIYIWGSQVEAGAFLTSYIPTGASVTARSADNASMTGTNFSSWYDASVGTFVARITGYASDQSASVIIGGNNNAFQLRQDALKFRSGIRGVVDLIGAAGPNIPAAPYTVAGAYKSGDSAICVNGGSVVLSTVSFTASSPASTGIGYDILSTTNYFNGHIASINYYNTRLPNATLQSLTT